MKNSVSFKLFFAFFSDESKCCERILKYWILLFSRYSLWNSDCGSLLLVESLLILFERSHFTFIRHTFSHYTFQMQTMPSYGITSCRWKSFCLQHVLMEGKGAEPYIRTISSSFRVFSHCFRPHSSVTFSLTPAHSHSSFSSTLIIEFSHNFETYETKTSKTHFYNDFIPDD